MSAAGVALIGAGRIAQAHADALRNTPNVSVSAVIDPNLKAAEGLARGFGARAFASVDEALDAKAFARAHVLVPPHLHAPLGEKLLGARIPTLMEKPVGVSDAEAQALVALATAQGTTLAVNQNYIFHPAFARFKRDLDAGRYGRLRFVALTAAVPLPQLAAKQFGHWMFERPSNIILEQIVHPLSQIVHLIGQSQVTASVAAPPVDLASGVFFHRAFDVTLKGARANAQLHMAFGENYPAWLLTALCDDGAVVVDGIKNSLTVHDRTRYLEAGDNAMILAKQGLLAMTQGLGGVSEYLGAQLKLVRRSDAFYRSLEASVRDFHASLDAGRVPVSDGIFGAHLVELCTQIGQKADVSFEPAPAPATLVAPSSPVPDFDVAVFGGTGFIGKHVVRLLLDAGYKVGVIGRNVRGLPEIFSDPRVSLLRGDVTRREDIFRGIGQAKMVVNLAHGGGGANRASIVEALTGSARAVGEACLEKQVKRLVFISSIASLYLGDGGEIIRPQTLYDTQGDERADYSFAKAEAERVLLELHRDRGLPVTIQRPGVVIGDGTSPFHSGVGFFNNEQHCLGWNDGRNPLPFVLVEDTAAAIVAALKADDSVHGRTDNIIGGVQMNARDYIAELARQLQRPLKFHPQSIWAQQAGEYFKWVIKRAGGKAAPQPSARDLLSRGMTALFDTSETERVLGWTPVKDPAVFIERGISVPVRALLA